MFKRKKQPRRDPTRPFAGAIPIDIESETCVDCGGSVRWGPSRDRIHLATASTYPGIPGRELPMYVTRLNPDLTPHVCGKGKA